MSSAEEQLAGRLQVSSELNNLVFLFYCFNQMDSYPQHNDIIFYNTPTGDVKIEVIFNDETFWLTQKRMAELFGVESHIITYHLKEIYKTGELEETTTARKIRVVQKEGNRDVSRDLDFYNLDAIIAVG